MQLKNAVASSEFGKAVIAALSVPAGLLYMEVLARLKIFGFIFDSTFSYMFVLTLAMGCLFSFVAMLLPGKARRNFISALFAVMGVWYAFHVTYFSNFHTFFSWQSLGQAKDVKQFWREAIAVSVDIWYVILAFFVPLVIMCALGSLCVSDAEKPRLPFSGVALAGFAVLFVPALLVINGTKAQTDDYTPYYYYTYLQNDLDMSFRYYGILNTTRLDVKQLIFGAPVERISTGDITDLGFVISDSDTEREYGVNVMEIDFDKAAASTKNEQLRTMDEYFKNLTPTQKNQYTGIFKGKNLVLITLEAFSDRIIDPEYSPMLYKMSHEGFVFKNFYNTIWGGSTATGEYATLTGNFYSNSNCLKKSGSTYQPFTLAHLLGAQGYTCLAYHNNTYTYYDRHYSHPNFGYQWIAEDNGLKLKHHSWPNSDKDMAEVTVGDYASLDTPFHAYYMSVSGHSGYNFAGNMMADVHRKDVIKRVRHYPVDLQAYYACQCEAELMIEVLVEELEKAGKLEDTVFAIEADHYPYALSTESLARLYGLPKAGLRYNLDLYRNQFILWTPSMSENPVTVEDYCSTIDILPTLANMFGLEYDSRLMMGRDIMAPGENFALLKVSGWSWISSQGRYEASERKFTPSESCTLSDKEKDEYVKYMNKMIRAKSTYSPLIIDLDYYGHLFGK